MSFQKQPTNNEGSIEAGITFNCAEQAMMYGKAVLFHDRKIAEKVLKAAEPREQKQLGRLVKNFVVRQRKESFQGGLSKTKQGNVIRSATCAA
nr:NADAR domain-containing protein [Brevibacillus nitrificans]